jgi:hypothetical protein
MPLMTKPEFYRLDETIIMTEKSKAKVEDETKKEQLGVKTLSDLARFTPGPELEDFNDVMKPQVGDWSENLSEIKFGPINIPSESSTLTDSNNNDENSEILLDANKIEAHTTF